MGRQRRLAQPGGHQGPQNPFPLPAGAGHYRAGEGLKSRSADETASSGHGFPTACHTPLWGACPDGPESVCGPGNMQDLTNGEDR